VQLGWKMIKIKFDPRRQIGAVELRLKKDVLEIIDGEAVKTDIGTFATERIRFQVRSGKPISNNFKSNLAPETIKYRQYLERYNATHPTYQASRANLTITGELMDSLSYEIKERGVNLLFKGQHKRYRGKTGYIGRVIKNSDLAKWLSEKGFTILDEALSTNEQFVRRITNIVSQYIRRGLRVRNRR
jgi:hypothetical protein